MTFFSLLSSQQFGLERGKENIVRVFEDLKKTCHLKKFFSLFF